jgi:hypothetical protein
MMILLCPEVNPGNASDYYDADRWISVLAYHTSLNIPVLATDLVKIEFEGDINTHRFS